MMTARTDATKETTKIKKKPVKNHKQKSINSNTTNSYESLQMIAKLYGQK